MVWWQKKFINGNDPEKLSKMRKTNPKSNKWDQEGRAEIYADITIYATDPARLVPKMCHHKNYWDLNNSQQHHSVFSGYNACSLLTLAPQCPGRRSSLVVQWLRWAITSNQPCPQVWAFELFKPLRVWYTKWAIAPIALHSTLSSPI